MPVIPFPTPNSKPADLARSRAVARELALSVRFKGRPADAARWALTAPPADVDAALAADDTLELIRARRALRKALKAGDAETVAKLRPVIARLCARIHEIGKRHRVKGWHRK